ncbi:MAG: acetyl CoA synthetase subunit alpha, partial [Elusimicrobia bacterium RIFCSPLOWO2_01_FULL_64_13]
MKAGQEGKHPTSVFRIGEGPLDAIFSPRNVAVVGATDKAGSVGRTILWNLISSPFGGTVFPVNPKRSGVLGVKAYPNVGSLPEPVDLAVIVTPSPTVPGVIRECVAAGVKGAVVISAGFKEIGAQGAELEREIQREARKGRMRIIGPNCLGVMRPHTGLNATFASTIARPGRVGFISQSGALCTAILDWSLRVNVGFSAFISIGSMLDVSWGDLIDYLGDDPKTESIVLYMEAIGDARSCLSAAREVALKKPIIVIKAGRTEAAAKAAVSHTGALVGSDKVLDAAFHRSGVIRVNTIAELFYMAEVLSKQPRPKGPNLAIVTNAGGPGVLATDALIHSGGELAKLSPETMEALNGILPSHWSRNNPVDVLGDAGPERYAKSVEIVGKDPNVDGMLVVLTPQAMTDPTRTAECLEPYARSLGKPVLASWMGAAEIARGEEILNASGIPTFDYPDTAARLFSLMWQHSESLDSLYETPSQTPDGADPKAKESVRGILNGILDSGRVLLTEAESKDLLSAYGIPAVPTSVARSEDEAAASAERTGYPVVLKLFSTTVTHKTDVGGVRLNLKNEESVRRAFQDIRRAVGELRGPEHFMGVTVQPMILTADGYELILGSSIDAQFGPVLLFGSGGQLVEIFKDQTVALPPLNTTLARRMMEKTRIYKALGGVRGRPPVDLGALERVLVRFSQLVADERRIKEIDINPLFASGDKLWVLDARVILYPREVKDEQIPKLA